MMKITPNNEGQIVQFVYNNGPTPGVIRTILIKEGGPALVGGYDFLRKAWRNFNSRYITDVKMLSTGVYVVADLSLLPSTVTGETMIDGFSKDGYVAHRDGELIYAVKKDVVEPPEPTMEFENGSLIIRGPGGGCSVATSQSNGVIINLVCGSTCFYSTPNDLLNELKKVLCQ